MSSQCPCHPEPFSIGNYRGDELEVVSGGLQDFTYLFSNAMELTVEVRREQSEFEVTEH